MQKKIDKNSILSGELKNKKKTHFLIHVHEQ